MIEFVSKILRTLRFPEDLAFRRVQPNVISFNSAINACGRGSRWPLAVQLLQRLRRRALQPTVASFGAPVAAVGRKRLWRQALRLVQTMEALGRFVFFFGMGWLGGGLERDFLFDEHFSIWECHRN